MLRLRQAMTVALMMACSLSAAWTRGDDLPAEAQSLLAEMDREMQAVRQRHEEELRGRTQRYLDLLEEMHGTFAKSGKLQQAAAIREQINVLRGGDVKAQPDPGSLTGYRGQTGKVLHFQVTGSQSGSVYGTDVYTDDSSLATAAVHAGVLAAGEKGVVKVTILPGQDSYKSTIRNGISSSPWSTYPSSYRVERVGPALPKPPTDPKVLTEPAVLSQFRGEAGKALLVQIVGRNTGSAWGSGTYTDDSDLATCCVHAGVLRIGQTGVVRVTILPGQASYEGSNRNGVSSASYGPFDGSFRIDGLQK